MECESELNTGRDYVITKTTAFFEIGEPKTVNEYDGKTQQYRRAFSQGKSG